VYLAFLYIMHSNFFVGLICQESALMEQQWKKWKRKEEIKYVFYDWFYASCAFFVSLTRRLNNCIMQVVAKLHGILRPFLLRRMKSDVELMLPRKKEIIIYANMTEHQKSLQDHLINETLGKYLDAKLSVGNCFLNFSFDRKGKCSCNSHSFTPSYVGFCLRNCIMYCTLLI
jgi:SNF2 family DNA or RNA helicase